MGQQSDVDQPEVGTWPFPRKINWHDKSTNKIVAHDAIWNNEIQPEQGRHMAYPLTIKMLTHVKSKQLLYSIQDDPWKKGAIDGEPKIEPSPVRP